MILPDSRLQVVAATGGGTDMVGGGNTTWLPVAVATGTGGM